MPLDKEKLFLVDLQRVNPSVADLYRARNPYTQFWDAESEWVQVNAVMNRVFGMAGELTVQQVLDMIPLIADHFGPDHVHREFLKNLKGGHAFYTKFNYSNFPKWSDYWEYELEQRDKIDQAFVCKIHDIFAFRSDIHPSDYISHLQALAVSCSAFGFVANDSGLGMTILYFESEEDEVLARIKFSEMVVE